MSPNNVATVLDEIDRLIDVDDTADRTITGGWTCFEDIIAAAHTHAWDPFSIDLSVDAASYRALTREQQHALKRVFGTIYRAESVVDDWMARMVAAIPSGDVDDDNRTDYPGLRLALQGQEHDEKMHRASLFRIATDVLGVSADDVERVARKHNNFVAETLFARFDRQMSELLRPDRTTADLHTAIFLYGIISEDVVANSDVVIRRAKGNAKYDEFNLPGMKQGQTNVRRDEGRHVRIAVLATHAFLATDESASARLLELSYGYMDLADHMLDAAKRSHGLIDEHLAGSYGRDVDSLYYYLVNMKRFAVRLKELGLREAVASIRDRVDTAVAAFTDEGRRPIVERTSFVHRRLGRPLLRVALARENQRLR